MTDRELNEELARLCGITVLTGDHPIGPFPCICRDGELHTTCDDSVCECAIWNPVGDWRQVYDFVIPALWRMGLSTCVHYEEEAFFARIQPFCRSWEVAVDTQEAKPSPRFVCLAAVEASEKLKETG